MKEKLLTLALTLALLLCGCGREAEAPPPAEAAERILEQVDFLDTLMQADEAVAGAYYRLDEGVEDYAVYLSGSGATCEEVAVLRMADGQGDRGAEIIEARREDLRRMLEGYRAEELPKLDRAVVETRGDVVYFVVAEDARQARDAIASLY